MLKSLQNQSSTLFCHLWWSITIRKYRSYDLACELAGRDSFHVTVYWCDYSQSEFTSSCGNDPNVLGVLWAATVCTGLAFIYYLGAHKNLPNLDPVTPSCIPSPEVTTVKQESVKTSCMTVQAQMEQPNQCESFTLQGKETVMTRKDAGSGNVEIS